MNSTFPKAKHKGLKQSLGMYDRNVSQNFVMEEEQSKK
jgi:hypothetical protein